MKIERFALSKSVRLVRAWLIILLLSPWSRSLTKAADDAPLEHYRLEPVAFSLDYPQDDPQANNRQFGPGMQLNDAGQVLFAAYWRDFFGQQNTLNLWSAGQVRRIATGGDPVPGFADMKFNNGLGGFAGNFDDYAFNKGGELSPLFGLENGSFVSVASVGPRAETNPNNLAKVFYEQIRKLIWRVTSRISKRDD